METINEKYLSTLDTFKKAKNAPFPGELYYYYGNELSKLLLASYTKQKKNGTAAVMERGLSSSGLSSPPNSSDPYTKTDSHFKGNAGKDKSIWGNWLKEQNAKSTDYEELNIQDWSKVTGAVKQPEKLEFTNNEQAKAYFNDNIAGMSKDIAKYPTNIPGSLFDDISKINQDNMNYIKSTLETPNEVWTDANKNTNYLKKCKAGTSKIVVNIAGQVIEFDLPGEAKISSLRKGNCLKK